MDKKIKVLHITYNDVSGGAARYVYRLHKSLIDINVDSKILVLKKESDDNLVYQSSSKKFFQKFSSKIDKLIVIPFGIPTEKFSSGVSLEFIHKDIKRIKPDIIHLHWINNGYVSVASLKKIKVPIIWSILDMWPILGGFHYEPSNISFRMSFLLKILFKYKKKVYTNLNIRIVSISNWMREKIIDSQVFENKKLDVIFPSLDTNEFKPADRLYSRKLLNLPIDKKIILFGANHSVIDTRKGFNFVLDSIEILDNSLKDKICLVIFGANEQSANIQRLNIETHYIGKMFSEIGTFDAASLSALYSSADLTIMPSIQEAFGQVGSESLSCGTPVVGFKKTGIEDIVIHKETGYLADNSDAKDLSNGVSWTLANLTTSEARKYCRKIAKENFDSNKIALKFKEIYNASLN